MSSYQRNLHEFGLWKIVLECLEVDTDPDHCEKKTDTRASARVRECASARVRECMCASVHLCLEPLCACSSVTHVCVCV